MLESELVKELLRETGLRLKEDENDRIVGFSINPGLMRSETLEEIIRYQLEGTQRRLITVYYFERGQRFNIEPEDLQRLRGEYHREELQEAVVSDLVNCVNKARLLLVVDPDPATANPRT